MILYMLVEDIKNNFKLFNNTLFLEPNISEKPFGITLLYPTHIA